MRRQRRHLILLLQVSGLGFLCGTVTPSTDRVRPPLEPPGAGIEGVCETHVERALWPSQAAVEFRCETVALLQHHVQPLEGVDVSVPVPPLDEVLLDPRLPRVEPDVGGCQCDIPSDLGVRGAAVQVQVRQLVLFGGVGQSRGLPLQDAAVRASREVVQVGRGHADQVGQLRV